MIRARFWGSLGNDWGLSRARKAGKEGGGNLGRVTWYRIDEALRQGAHVQEFLSRIRYMLSATYASISIRTGFNKRYVGKVARQRQSRSSGTKPEETAPRVDGSSQVEIVRLDAFQATGVEFSGPKMKLSVCLLTESHVDLSSSILIALPMAKDASLQPLKLL